MVRVVVRVLVRFEVLGFRVRVRVDSFGCRVRVRVNDSGRVWI